jgi:molybdopterin-biosynthesis enzyme MoeA-like protein
MSKQVQVALLLTGNELMSGDTVDSNSSRIALALGAHKMSSSTAVLGLRRTTSLQS